MSNQPFLLIGLNQSKFSGILVCQLLNRINSASGILLRCNRLLRANFGKVGLVSSFEPFRGLVVLLLANFFG